MSVTVFKREGNSFYIVNKRTGEKVKWTGKEADTIVKWERESKRKHKKSSSSRTHTSTEKRIIKEDGKVKVYGPSGLEAEYTEDYAKKLGTTAEELAKAHTYSSSGSPKEMLERYRKKAPPDLSEAKVEQEVDIGEGQKAKVVDFYGRKYLVGTDENYKTYYVEIPNRTSGGYNWSAEALKSLMKGKVEDRPVEGYVKYFKEKAKRTPTAFVESPTIQEETHYEVYGMGQPVKYYIVGHLQEIKVPYQEVQERKYLQEGLKRLVMGQEGVKTTQIGMGTTLEQTGKTMLHKTTPIQLSATIEPKKEDRVEALVSKIIKKQEEIRPKTGREKVKEFTSKLKKIFTSEKVKKSTKYLSPVVSGGAGFVAGTMDFGSDVAEMVKRPIQTAKQVGSVITQPVKTSKAIEQQFWQFGKELGEELQYAPEQGFFRLGKTAGYLTTSYYVGKGATKLAEKITKPFTKVKKTITYDVKKVFPHTKEYKLGATDRSIISTMKVKPFAESMPKGKNVIVKITENRLIPKTAQTYDIVQKTRYEILTQSQLKSLLRKGLKGRLQQPTKYLSRSYSLIGYTDEFKLPKYLKPETIIQRGISLKESALRSPYLSNLPQVEKEFRKINKYSKSLLKQGVYFEKKTISFVEEAPIKQYFSRLTKRTTSITKNILNKIKQNRKMAKLSKSLSKSRTQTILLQKEQPIRLNFKGLEISKKIKEISQPLSSSFMKVGRMVSTLPVGLAYFKRVTKTPEKSLFREEVKSSVKVKPLEKVRIKPIQTIQPSSKTQFKPITKIKIVAKPIEDISSKLKEITKSINKTITRTTTSTIAKTSQQTKTISSSFPIPSKGATTTLPFKTKLSKAFGKRKSKKSKKYAKWQKVNPWAKVSRVRL